VGISSGNSYFGEKLRTVLVLSTYCKFAKRERERERETKGKKKIEERAYEILYHTFRGFQV
jgi:hypothetical protein